MPGVPWTTPAVLGLSRLSLEHAQETTWCPGWKGLLPPKGMCPVYLSGKVGGGRSLTRRGCRILHFENERHMWRLTRKKNDLNAASLPSLPPSVRVSFTSLSFLSLSFALLLFPYLGQGVDSSLRAMKGQVMLS